MSPSISTTYSPDETENNSEETVERCFKSFIKRLTLRKPMSELQAEAETQNKLRRTLNSFQLLTLGLGCIIGTGIFVLSGQAAAQYAGPSVIISFIVAGIVAILSAMSYSEMASMIPISGSAYTYTYVTMGEYFAWVIGWDLALLYQLAASTVAVGWSAYVVELIDLVSGYHPRRYIVKSPIAWRDDPPGFYVTGEVINLPAIAIVLGITVLLVIGVRETAIINAIFVVFKILTILVFIFACCGYVNTDNYKPFFPSNKGSFDQFGITGMLKGATFVFFAYVGFDAVTTVAQEAEKPQRSLPIGILGSLLISSLLYVGVCTVMVGLVPYTKLDSHSPILEAITGSPHGLWLSIIMNLGVIASLATVALVNLLAQTRVFFAMAQDGLLPSIFAKIHSHTKTPWVSTVISGVTCAVISGVCPVDIIGEMTSISALIAFSFVHISVIIMRYTHDDMVRGFKVPFGPWLIPVTGTLLCILLLINTSEGTGIRFGIWMALVHIVYFSYSFGHSKRRPPKRVHSRRRTNELAPQNINIVFILTPMTNSAGSQMMNNVDEVDV